MWPLLLVMLTPLAPLLGDLAARPLKRYLDKLAAKDPDDVQEIDRVLATGDRAALSQLLARLHEKAKRKATG